ncbi:hypothetical protein KC19_5G201400 [Ceratodon purpureus]|uniref:Uncharacterized protein n=1 Tax=Ceratodon purpureus TaxID=3225 RepID=A0A8T0I3J1_CERPU|nr:hypothetical protein KC19_5G201400 [Ceratodon purpureus]
MSNLRNIPSVSICHTHVTESRTKEELRWAASEAGDARPLQRRQSSRSHARPLLLHKARPHRSQQWDLKHSCGCQPTQLLRNVEIARFASGHLASFTTMPELFPPYVRQS